MPTSTFFNLPPPKREKLLRAAIGEFARMPYGEVSINRIIQTADIPRGSFYQYFSDKTDLFRHVLRQFGERLEALLLDCLSACHGRPMDMPLVLFDRVAAQFRSNREDFRWTMDIVRQNAGLDMSQFWGFSALRQGVMERLDLGGLDVRGPEEADALIALLWECIVHGLALACCGKLTAEESRRRLACKVALIRRGVEKQEASEGQYTPRRDGGPGVSPGNNIETGDFVC